MQSSPERLSASSKVQFLEDKLVDKINNIKQEIEALNPENRDLQYLPLETLQTILNKYKQIHLLTIGTEYTSTKIKDIADIKEETATESPELLADFESAKEYWMNWYQEYGIDASSLKGLQLSAKGQETMQEMTEKYDFDKILMIPAGISPQDLVANLKFLIFDNTEAEANQNSDKSNPIWINGDIKESTLWSKQTTQPEVIFLKNKDHVDSEADATIKKIKNEKKELLTNIIDNYCETTRDHGYKQIIKMADYLDLKGLDIVQAMILDRQYFDETSHHLFDYGDNNATWLTENQIGTSQCVRLSWNPDFCQWSVSLNDDSSCDDILGSVFTRRLETATC